MESRPLRELERKGDLEHLKRKNGALRAQAIQDAHNAGQFDKKRASARKAGEAAALANSSRHQGAPKAIEIAHVHADWAHIAAHAPTPIHDREPVPTSLPRSEIVTEETLATFRSRKAPSWVPFRFCGARIRTWDLRVMSSNPIPVIVDLRLGLCRARSALKWCVDFLPLLPGCPRRDDLASHPVCGRHGLQYAKEALFILSAELRMRMTTPFLQTKLRIPHLRLGPSTGRRQAQADRLRTGLVSCQRLSDG